MADNKTIDNGTLTDYAAASDEVTYSGDTADVQLVKPAHVAGAEGAKTVEAVTQTVASAAPAAAVVVGGTDGTNVRHLKTDTSGELQVDVLSSALPTGAATAANQLPDGHNVTVDNAAGASAVNIQDGGNSITIDGSVSITGSVDTELPTAAAISAENTAAPTAPSIYNFPLLFDGTNWDRAPGNSTDGALVNLGANNDVTVAGVATAANQLPDGHNVTVDNASGASAVNIQDGGNSITIDGSVGVSSLPASTNTIEVVGDAAHDAAAAGNPVLVAATHETAADSAPTNRLATVTDGDVTRLSATDGALFVIPSGPQQWKARLTGLIAADTTVKAAPGAGLSLYIQTVTFSIGAATASSIMLEESTTTPVFGPHYLEAINGRGLAVNFNPPIKIAANTLLSATGTGATTATLDVYGFTAPG